MRCVAEWTLATWLDFDSITTMAPQAGKSSLSSIVAVGLDGAIGVSNRLPWNLRSDLRFFKETTKSNIVVMGRKTHDSIGGCLPHRTNIVLSHRATLFDQSQNCIHAHGVGETLFIREKWKRKEAFVIGGALTYQQFAPFVDRYLITVVKSTFQDADAFFDQGILGNEDDWSREELDVEKIDDPNADEFEFSVFELRHRHPEQVARRREELIAVYRSKNHFTAKKDVLREVASGKPFREAVALS